MSEEILSNVELAILSILNKPVIDNAVRTGKNRDTEERVYAINTLPVKKLQRYITTSMTMETDDDYRLFTCDINSVMALPKEDFGVVLVSDRYVKENSFNMLNVIPRGYPHGTFDAVWQFDFIYTDVRTLRSRLVQSVFAVKGNQCIPLYPLKTPKQIIIKDRGRHIREITQHFALCTSIVEDYMLNQFWHLDLTDSVTISTYGKEHDIKSFLDIRDEPLTKTGQRKRVLHWVSGHRRVTKGGKEVKIEKHLRGLEHFNLGGFDVDITQPRKQQ